MQGHQNTPFTIDNILSGSLFSKRGKKETKCEEDSTSIKGVDLSVSSVSPVEEDSVDVEGSDSDSEVSSTSHVVPVWSSDVESSLSNRSFNSTQSDREFLQNRMYEMYLKSINHDLHYDFCSDWLFY